MELNLTAKVLGSLYCFLNHFRDIKTYRELHPFMLDDFTSIEVGCCLLGKDTRRLYRAHRPYRLGQAT